MAPEINRDVVVIGYLDFMELPNLAAFRRDTIEGPVISAETFVLAGPALDNYEGPGFYRMWGHFRPPQEFPNTEWDSIELYVEHMEYWKRPWSQIREHSGSLESTWATESSAGILNHGRVYQSFDTNCQCQPKIGKR